MAKDFCHSIGYTLESYTASFKGIPFEVLYVSDNYSRRLAISNFPYSEKVITQNVGRNAKIFTIRGRFYGYRHKFQGDLLRNVLNEPTAGWFSHPELGAQYVYVQQFSVSKDYINAKTVLSFSATFVEAEREKSSLKDAAIQLAMATLLTGIFEGFDNVLFNRSAVVSQLAEYGDLFLKNLSSLNIGPNFKFFNAYIKENVSNFTKGDGSSAANFIINIMHSVYSANFIKEMQKLSFLRSVMAKSSNLSSSPDLESKKLNILAYATGAIYFCKILEDNSDDLEVNSLLAYCKEAIYSLEQSRDLFANFSEFRPLDIIFRRAVSDFAYIADKNILKAPNQHVFSFDASLTRFDAVWQLYQDRENLSKVNFKNKNLFFGQSRNISLLVKNQNVDAY